MSHWLSSWTTDRALVVSVCSLIIGAIIIVAIWPHARTIVFKSNLHNLAGPPRVSFWKGNLGQLFDSKGWQFHREIVRKYGGAVKIHGLCGDVQVYVSDPKALYHIVTKDQDVYEETRFFLVSNLVCFGKGMVSVTGAQHRKQRKLLNPVFNINHMRALMPTFYRITNDLCDVLRQEILDGIKIHRKTSSLTSEPLTGVVMDVQHWMKKAALEFIGQGGLGYSFGPLNKSGGNAYGESVRNFAPTIFSLSILRQFLPTLHKLGTPAFQRWVVTHFPSKRVQRLRSIVDVMYNTSVAVLESKKRALETAGTVSRKEDGQNDTPQPDGEANGQIELESARMIAGDGKDVMSILLKENIKADENDRLSDEEVMGQMSTLVFAAQDTTSAAISAVLQELASHHDNQERLRQEITEARSRVHGGELQYDELNELPYLDAVCRETLRLRPPIYMLHRTTQQDIVLPLSKPVVAADGTTLLHSIPLRRNQNVIIAIEAANRNPDIWGINACEWCPERWIDSSPESAAKMKLPGVYSSMMTFLGGGRSCIGFKFALIEIKVVLSALLESFRFELSPNIEYEWKLGGIVSPGVKDDPIPKLPLLVSMVDQRSGQ